LHDGEVRHVWNICSIAALMNYYFKYALVQYVTHLRMKLPSYFVTYVFGVL